MTDMKTWEVSFKVTVPAYMQWEDGGFEDNRSDYTRIDPGQDCPYITIPADAQIRAVPNPVQNGFYVCEDSRTMYQRIEGAWVFWSDSYSAWRESSLNDTDVNDGTLTKVNVVA